MSVYCKHCRSEILPDATICPVCCNSQSKGWILLKNIGVVLGLIAIVGSAATYMAIGFSDLRKVVAWKDEVQVVAFSMMRPSTFLNKGDGEILISHIELESNVTKTSTVLRINKILGPSSFCVREVSEEMVKWRTEHDPIISSYFSKEEWEGLIRVSNNHNTCIKRGYYYDNDPGFMQSVENLKGNLNTFEAKGTIVFYSGKTGKEIRQQFPVVGVFHISKNVDCYDNIRDFVPEFMRSFIEKGF